MKKSILNGMLFFIGVDSLRYFIIVLMSLWVSTGVCPVNAADNDKSRKSELSRQYVEAIDAPKNIAEVLDLQLSFSISSIFANTPEIRDNSEIATQIAEETKQLYMKKISDALIIFYADFYTKEELQALVDFNTSSIGKSILSRSKERSQGEQQLIYGMSGDYVKRFKHDTCVKLKCQKTP